MNEHILKLKSPKSIAMANHVRTLEKEGRRIIKLQTGDPYFKTHPLIIQTLQESIANEETHYVHNQGLPELREAISCSLKEIKGISINADENVLITAGGAQAIFLSLMTIINQGDEVILFEPYYPQYEYIIKILGGVVRTVPVILEEGIKRYSIDFEVFNEVISSKTKAIVVNSPNNPSGKIYDRGELDRIIKKILDRDDIYLISDEVYSIVIDDKSIHVSVLEYASVFDRIIYINSFSKTYAMTGWRLGYVVANSQLIERMIKLIQLNTTCVPAFIQRAGVTALKSREIQAYTSFMVDKYNEKRKKVYNLIKDKILFKIYPEGAFYYLLYFPAISEIEEADALVYELLNSKHVSTVPAYVYGKSFKSFLRISFSVDDDCLKEGIERIIEFLERLC